MTPAETLPDWVKVGTRCPKIGGFRGTVVGYATIEKINRRYIVAGGENYSIPRRPTEDRLRRTGDARWAAPGLYDPECATVVSARRRTVEANAAAKIRGGAEEIDRAARDGEIDVAKIRAAIASIEAMLFEAEDGES